jgi:hypothetical protein
MEADDHDKMPITRITVSLKDWLLGKETCLETAND